MALKFKCPECHRELFFASGEVGAPVRCIHCDASFDLPRTATAVEPRRKLSRPSKKGLSPGVRGWLLWFCVYNGVVLPILLAVLGISLFDGLGPFVPQITRVKIGVTLFVLVLWFLHAEWASLKLFFIKPSAVLNAQVYVVSTLIYAGTTMGLIHWLSESRLEIIDMGAVVRAAISTVVQCFIWFQYFRVSERVRITYVD